MRKFPLAIFWIVLLGGFSHADADTLYYQAVGFSATISDGGSFQAGWQVPQFSSSFYVTAMNVWMGSTNGDSLTAYAQIQCFTASNYTGTCSEMGTLKSEPLAITQASGSQIREFRFATSTPGHQLLNTRYYVFSVFSNSSKILSLLGETLPNICTSGCTGTPYNLIYGNTVDTTAIDWNLYRQTFIFSSSTVGIATSSPLWGQYTATDTIAQMGSCTEVDNIFGRAICASFAYLFLPNPQVMTQWTQLPTLMQTKFPFSWVSDVQGSITGLTASTTANAPTYSLSLHDLGLGSTTPIGNLLPNFTAFSSSTALSYFPSGLWAAGQLLIAATLWLALGWDIYATVRRRHAHV